MDTLDNTEWDVLIVGTGLQQSLLALYVPLSRVTDRRDLTDAVYEELFRAQTRKSSILTRMTIMAAQRLPSVCKKLKSGRRG